MYAVVGVTRVLEDVEISQRNRPLYRDMQRFIEQDFCQVPHEAQTADKYIVDKFKRYFTARTDIRLVPKKAKGNFRTVSMSDDRADISQPAWLQKDGVGYMITSYVGKVDFVAKAFADGQIRLILRGLDIRRQEDKSKLLPYWIDYTKLTINGKTIFDTLTPAWHDKPYIYTTDAKTGEEIKIQVEWLPHRSDT